jgi:holo-[acyl-carrier protein] synthase
VPVIGIGTDIIECLRIAKMIERHGELFLTRVYTPHEIEYCTARKAATQHYAGRFAAKEAVLKALGTGWGSGAWFRDVEVVREPGLGPTVRLHDGALRRARDLGVARIHVSITHERGHAAAVAVLEG